MSPGVTVLVMACVLVAGLMFGLWLGERGRRQAAERIIAFGAPDLVNRPAVMGPGPADAESRYAAEASQMSQEAIERATDEIVATYASAKIPVDRREARQQAVAMLSGQDVNVQGEPPS